MEWISVKDQLPIDGQHVLAIIFKNGIFFIPFTTCHKGGGYFRGEEEDNVEDPIGDYSEDISHWMPLPEPPKL